MVQGRWTILSCAINKCLLIDNKHSLFTKHLHCKFIDSSEPNSNSFGATTVSNLKPSSSIFWLHTVFAIIYFIILLIVLRHFTNLFATESRDDSANTVMITNIPKAATADLINQHFK